MPKIILPDPLLKYSNYNKHLQLNFNNFKEMCDHLSYSYPLLFAVLFDNQQRLKGFINFYKDSNYLSEDSLNHILFKDEDVIEIIASVSGG